MPNVSVLDTLNLSKHCGILSTMQKILIGFLKGIALFVFLWALNAFIAFVIFNRETDVSRVLPSWFAADASVYALLLLRFNFINRFVNAGFIFTMLVLVVLYLLPANNNFPKDALVLNAQLNEAHENKYNYAEALFFEVEKRWTSPVRQYLLEPHKVFFIKDAAYFWNLSQGSYVDSNVQAHLYRNLLLRSVRFAPDEVRVLQHFCTNSPHGVVVFKKNSEKIYADLWAVDNFEEYRFGQYTKTPCDTLSGQGFEM